MTAYAWDVVADTVKEILPADEHRDELVVQLNAQAVNGADPVFLGFGEDATTETGLMLGGIGHTVRVLGAKARLAVSALSAAVSSGGIETHTSIEYRHVLNYPLWQKQGGGGGGEKPVMIHPSPVDDTEVGDDFDPFMLMFDMNVQAGAGNILLYESPGDTVVSTIPIGDAIIDGGAVSFSLVAYIMDPGASYYFKIASGVIESAADGTAWSGISDSTTWNFTTA